MKRLAPVRLFVLACLLGLAFRPILAQTAPKPDPWKHGTEEYLLQGTLARDQASHHWTGTTTGGWLHFATDNVEVGILSSYVNTGSVSGVGAGPIYEYNFPAMKGGHLFLSGDVEALAGDLGNASSTQYATAGGYKKHIGTSGALRASVRYTRAGQSTDTSNQLNTVAFVLGISFGLPQ